MCCFVLILGFLGPRIAFLAVWIFGDDRVQNAFSNNFWWPLLGVLFLPWTALAYVAAWAPTGGVTGVGWLVVGLGFLLDIASYASRSAGNRYQSASA
ncbi:MAG: hypothetical protein QG661_2725 [Actinomycetota bacterium]|jgi:hypothetical protein|nr:hypothetical protein [Actinomycetota bacterium]